MSSYFSIYAVPIRNQEEVAYTYPDSKVEFNENGEMKVSSITSEVKDYKDKLCLVSLCTSPARELASNVHIEYDKNVDLTDELLDEIIDYYNEQINSYNNLKEHYAKEIEDIRKDIGLLFANAKDSSKVMDVYDELKERMCDYSTDSIDDEIESLTNIRDKFIAVRYIISENANEFTEKLYKFIYRYD